MKKDSRRQSFSGLLLIVALIGAGACGTGPAHVSAAHGHIAPQQASPPSGDPSALAACAARRDYPGLTVVAAFDTTVGTLRRWHGPGQPTDRPIPEPQFFHGRPDSDVMHLCYLDGPIAAPHPPQLADFDRAAVVIDANGATWLLVAGHQADMQSARPSVNGA